MAFKLYGIYHLYITLFFEKKIISPQIHHDRIVQNHFEKTVIFVRKRR